MADPKRKPTNPVLVQNNTISVRLTDIINEIVRHRLIVNQTIQQMIAEGKILEEKRECAECYLEGANKLADQLIESLMFSLRDAKPINDQNKEADNHE